jgi:hypothetical protein
MGGVPDGLNMIDVYSESAADETVGMRGEMLCPDALPVSVIAALVAGAALAFMESGVRPAITSC